MSGLDPEQLDELVCRIEEQLEEPWHKGIGRPKDLSLREAVVVASGYMRQNIIQEVWAEIFDTSQPVISGIIAKFTPLIDESTEEDRPTAEEAEEAVAREQTVLVDGFLAPTWSWRDAPELWSGKHKTTGFNVAIQPGWLGVRELGSGAGGGRGEGLVPDLLCAGPACRAGHGSPALMNCGLCPIRRLYPRLTRPDGCVRG